jgi:hypothetical protein
MVKVKREEGDTHLPPFCLSYALSAWSKGKTSSMIGLSLPAQIRSPVGISTPSSFWVRGGSVEQGPRRTLFNKLGHLLQVLIRRVHPNDRVLPRYATEPSGAEETLDEVSTGGEETGFGVGTVDVDEVAVFLYG